MGALTRRGLAAAAALLAAVAAAVRPAAAQGPPGSLANDTAALLAFKASLGDPAALSSWAGQDPCSASWTGVGCAGGRVTSL